MNKLLALLLFAICSLPAMAQFKSLQIRKPGNLLAYPIIKPGSEAVEISFDELAEDNRYLRYRLVHCDALWRPSEISDIEYASGFNQGDILDYALSDLTITHYVHYTLTLPNDEVSPLISGNYLVEIFDQDNPDDVLLQAKFMVSEELAHMALNATSRTDIDYNDAHQQLSVHADLNGADIDDPFNDLILVVIQNGNPSSRRVLTKPLRANRTEAVYDHQQELIFPAGNEYRRFDTANSRYPGMHLVYIDATDAELSVDHPRAEVRYQYDEDQGGRFFVDEINASNPDVNADYLWTHFTLEMPQLHEPVYIDGDLTLRSRDSDAMMVYDPSIGAYVKSLLLKQGMYNYAYVTHSGNRIEGDHYQTGNEYLALLYYRPHGARFDRLISSAVIHTNK